MKPAIKVEHLSKLYHLGSEHKSRHRTLRDAFGKAFTAPWRRIQQFNRAAVASLPNGVYSANGETSDDAIIWAVKDLSFEVRPGEMIGIMGRNGSGKSTLLRILSGVTEPTSGRVSIYGRVGSLLEVGTGIHPELSGRENIYLSGAIAGLSRREIARHFDAIVAFAELEKFIDTPVKHYSTGMHMRLGFAVASHLDPHVMLVDEALSVGDVAFQAKCCAHLDRLHRAGMSIILISHSPDEIVQLCDHAIWLDKGVARARGRCTDVIHDYLKAMGQGETEMPSNPQWVADEEARALLKAELKQELQAELKEEIQREIREEIQPELKHEIQAELKEEIRVQLKDEMETELRLAAEFSSPPLEETTHQPRRWGSRQVDLLTVRLLNAQGQEQRTFATGEEMIIDLVYLAHERILRPVFGIVFTPATTPAPGALPPCVGVGNSKWSNQIVDSIGPGRGTVRCRVSSLPCYQGYHFIDVAVCSEAEDVYYDYEEKFCNFHVSPRPELDSQGYPYLPTQWEYPNICEVERVEEEEAVKTV
jgi:ABC-type polysaccharide/polyol phosphate transport system ATPase subunit